MEDELLLVCRSGTSFAGDIFLLVCGSWGLLGWFGFLGWCPKRHETGVWVVLARVVGVIF